MSCAVWHALCSALFCLNIAHSTLQYIAYSTITYLSRPSRYIVLAGPTELLGQCLASDCNGSGQARASPEPRPTRAGPYFGVATLQRAVCDDARYSIWPLLHVTLYCMCRCACMFAFQCARARHARLCLHAHVRMYAYVRVLHARLDVALCCVAGLFYMLCVLRPSATLLAGWTLGRSPYVLLLLLVLLLLPSSFLALSLSIYIYI